DMCSDRNSSTAHRHCYLSLADWDMCSDRNLMLLMQALFWSLADWDMCSDLIATEPKTRF
ncbi:hypothetical protein QN372_20980, partial [Undibacterium sp. RTI2.1]